MMSRLFCSRVTVSDEPPQRFTYFLHGVFGSGGNLRGIAKSWLLAMRERHGETDHGAVLVDLRMHGRSQGLAAPHTLETAARDVIELSQLEHAPISGIVGHSFGGKVALAVVRALSGDLEHAALLDSMPGARVDHRGSETTMRVFELLRGLPKKFGRREEMIATLETEGLSKDLASWLAMNLVPTTGDGTEAKPVSAARRETFELRLDLDAIDALLQDYFVQDFWPLLEQPPGRVRYKLIIGGASNVYNADDYLRSERAIGPRLSMRVLPGASHFVHVDDPNGVIEALAERS
jgi:esterase